MQENFHFHTGFGKAQERTYNSPSDRREEPKQCNKRKSKKKISKPKDLIKCDKRRIKCIDKEVEFHSEDANLEPSSSEVSLAPSQDSPWFESSFEEKTETG